MRQCSVTCGIGIQKRAVSCRAVAREGWLLPGRLSSEACSQTDRPESERICSSVDCTWPYRWETSAWSLVSLTSRHYLRQGGNVFARLCLFVCLSVCLCVCKITQKVMDGSFWNFKGMLEWHKLPLIQFWGWSGRNPGFWITLKFSLPLLSMGHKGNRCKTEDGAAT